MFLRVTLPLSGANFLNQAARTVMAIVGPVLAVEFGLTASELGLLAACMFAAYALAQLPLGIALDTIGPRKLQTGLMLLTAAGFALFAFSSGMTGFAVARVILGVGISAGLMAIIKGNAQWFAPAKVAGMTGLAMAIATLGSVLTTAPVQAVLPLLGWRGVFWVLCAVSLAVALWIFLSVTDKPAPAVRKSLRQELAVMGGILGSAKFWRYGPFAPMLSVVNFAYMGLWAGPWLRDVAGFDGATAAQTLLGYTLAALAGSALVGQATSRAVAAGRSGFFVPLVCIGFVIAGQVGLALQPTAGIVVLGLWLLIAFFGAGGTAGYIAVGQMFPPEQMGRVATACNTLTLGGAFLLQSAIGWILDLYPRTAAGGWDPAGYSWALGLSILLQLLATANLLTARRRPTSSS
jgi:predicted MFS family arabinose efflux permease